MKLFSTSVAIACDGTSSTFKVATAIRGVLEIFGLQVYFYQLTQKQNVLDFKDIIKEKVRLPLG